ncbi:MAG: response regulator [Bacillati bacterium ANGP1]|uniref:Response regulator n=1 Tax=Candidatus Segetimicrobium genomatis TaxID=2569760 RepID=A0A537JU77_9BACT|nr:MAG: response regulator [Terrabacteria group bacterium ANGP1]
MAVKSVEILLVEDNQAHAEITVRALRRANISRIEIAKDGAEAVEFLFSDDHATPKVILLDLDLPKVDGIEVLRRIKADPNTRQIPVIVLSASRDNQKLQECFTLGVSGYIVKPVDLQQFVDAVRLLDLHWILKGHAPS